MSTGLTLFCFSGNERVLSIDPSSLAIITLLHWHEIDFELVHCCKFSESPSRNPILYLLPYFHFIIEELPAMRINDTFYSGYRSIYRGLNSVFNFNEKSDSLIDREFLLLLNHDLLVEEFNDEIIFRNFTEEALLSAKSRYWWNFGCSRISPLNSQISRNSSSSLNNVLSDPKKAAELENILKNTSSIEVKCLIFSHLLIRSLLPKRFLIDGSFSEFMHEMCETFNNSKPFKAKIMGKPLLKPVYKYEPDEEISYCNNPCIINGKAYTGLFGVILAIGVLYSIKNR